MTVDPWRFVDADDELVADFLAGTVEAVLEGGGRLHPALRIIARDGDLSIAVEVPDGEPIISLPSSLFLPISRVTWDDGDALRFHDEDDALTDEAFALLTMQVALHNAMGKLPRLAATHPELADLPDVLVDAVRAVKPTFRTEQRSPVSLFWSNRVFRIPAGPGLPPEPMALPIVDCLDHRAQGAVGDWTGDAFVVTAAHAGSPPTCFLDYGHDRDPLDLAIAYGFADPLAAPSAGMATDREALVRIRDAAEDVVGEAARIIAAAVERQLTLIDLAP